MYCRGHVECILEWCLRSELAEIRDMVVPSHAARDIARSILAGNDNLAFRGAFNKPVGGGYVPFLDFNGDGQINSADNLAFRGRFNKSLTWTA